MCVHFYRRYLIIEKKQFWKRYSPKSTILNVDFALKLRIYRSLKSVICLKWILKNLSTTLHTGNPVIVNSIIRCYKDLCLYNKDIKFWVRYGLFYHFLIYNQTRKLGCLLSRTSLEFPYYIFCYFICFISVNFKSNEERTSFHSFAAFRFSATGCPLKQLRDDLKILFRLWKPQTQIFLIPSSFQPDGVYLFIFTNSDDLILQNS